MGKDNYYNIIMNTGSVLYWDNRLQVYLYNCLLLTVIINSSKRQTRGKKVFEHMNPMKEFDCCYVSMLSRDSNGFNENGYWSGGHWSGEMSSQMIKFRHFFNKK